MPRRKRLTDVEFVTAWAKSQSLDEVLQATGLSRIGAQTRAAKLRKAGVLLQRFRRGRKRIDVGALNAIVKKLRGGGGRARKAK